MKKIIYVHPAIVNYRAPLFERLGALGVEFLFTHQVTGENHLGRESHRLLKDFRFPYILGTEQKWFPFSSLVPELLKLIAYDLVVFTGASSVPFLAMAVPLRACGVKILIFDERWRYPSELLLYRLMRPVVRFLLAHCVDGLIPAGSRAQRMFAEEFGVPIDRLFPAFNTTVDLAVVNVENAVAQNIRERVKELVRGRRTLLYLARIVEVKGLDVLLQALNHIPADTCLIVVGDGDKRMECEVLAAELALGDRVHFLGACEVTESPYFFCLADLFILPTRFLPSESVNCEYWGFTVNEAMSLSVPVVTTDAVGASFDLILHGETGFLARNNDPDDLAKQLKFALSDPEATREIGLRGRERLLATCDYDQNVLAYQAAIARVFEQSE